MFVPELTSAEQCDELIAAENLSSRDHLQLAFVDGGRNSKDRRTLSTDFYPNVTDVEHPATKLYQLFFDLARQAAGYELDFEGQEPLNWLDYPPGYEYRSHCDGNCGADRIKLGDRVATSLLYCKVAEKGGATIFPHRNMKISPAVGSLLFFTYNPDPQQLSWHAACPVLKGRKNTATQWYREGVGDERDWSKFADGEITSAQTTTSHNKKPPFEMKTMKTEL
eukprot:TRINITY_DN12194_c0_g1_i1.p1 TRINITY_DN12194_c0_g1~~TRINITY_DN12194_c0_g1_i1.p1  ORF type:complete len:223 (-),score=30.39 TRINITY_DN12194_c0_g1_i1:430-1098(-)